MPTWLQELRNLLRDPHFRVYALTILAAGLTLLNVPADRQTAAITFVGGLFTLATIWSAGQHYVDGKTVEGTVPAGMQSTGQKLVVQVGAGTDIPPSELLHQAAGVIQGIEPQLSGQLKTVADKLASAAQTAATTDGDALTEAFEMMNAQASNSSASNQAGAKKLAGALVIALLMLTCLTGCSASAPFRTYAAAMGPQVATELTTYATADSTLGGSSRAQILSDAGALQSATADVKTITEPTVKTAWVRAEPEYLNYVSADPLLDPDAKALREANAATMDALINQEEARSPLFGGAGAPSQ